MLIRGVEVVAEVEENLRDRQPHRLVEIVSKIPQNFIADRLGAIKHWAREENVWPVELLDSEAQFVLNKVGSLIPGPTVTEWKLTRVVAELSSQINELLSKIQQLESDSKLDHLERGRLIDDKSQATRLLALLVDHCELGSTGEAIVAGTEAILGL